MTLRNLKQSMIQFNKPIWGIVLFAVFYLVLNTVIFPAQFNALTKIHIGTIYLYFLIPAIILFLFAGIVLIRSIINHDISLLLIIAGVFTFGLSYFFGFLNWNPTGSSVPLTPLYAIQLFLSNLATIFFVIHYELLVSRASSSKILGIILFLLSPLMTLNTFEILTNTVMPTELFNLKMFAIILTQLGSLLAFYRVLTHAATILVSSHALTLSSPIVMQYLGTWFFIMHILFEILDNFVSIYNTPWLVIATMVFMWAYAHDPKSILLKPTNIMLYGITDSSGIPFYFRATDPFFQEQLTKNDGSILIAGLISALTSISQEVIGASKIDSMSFGDRSLIIVYNKPFYLVCIASKGNYFLLKTLDGYLMKAKKQLELKYPQGTNRPVKIDTSTQEIFQLLNEEFFAFLHGEGNY